MKKYAFKGLGLVLAVALIVGCFAGCAKINYVTDGAIQAINEVKDGSWKTKGQEDAGTSEADYDKPVIEEFKAGTYGGVEFKGRCCRLLQAGLRLHQDLDRPV